VAADGDAVDMLVASDASKLSPEMHLLAFNNVEDVSKTYYVVNDISFQIGAICATQHSKVYNSSQNR
jgi:hypothetical protein